MDTGILFPITKLRFLSYINIAIEVEVIPNFN